MTTPSPVVSDLKPCPFCGGAPRIVVRGGAAGVKCTNQHFVSTYGADKAEAIEAWNHRAAAPPHEEGAVADDVKELRWAMRTYWDAVKLEGKPEHWPRIMAIMAKAEAALAHPAQQSSDVSGLVEALKVEREWHDLRADLSFDEARECSERGEKSEEMDAMRAHALHSARVEAIVEALAQAKQVQG